MKQTILIHGAPYEKEFYNPEKASPSNTNWFPWLQKQLALRDELCQALEFPKPYDPSYEQWVQVFEQMSINNETVLIGHSCGGGFLLRYLSEHSELKPKQVILVAPWLDPKHELTENFFDFQIDPSLASRTNLEVFISSDDDEEMQTSFQKIKEVISEIHVHQFSDKGHFCEKDFPELLELLK